jgi:hypothetical protein
MLCQAPGLLSRSSIHVSNANGMSRAQGFPHLRSGAPSYEHYDRSTVMPMLTEPPAVTPRKCSFIHSMLDLTFQLVGPEGFQYHRNGFPEHHVVSPMRASRFTTKVVFRFGALKMNANLSAERNLLGQ